MEISRKKFFSHRTEISYRETANYKVPRLGGFKNKLFLILSLSRDQTLL